MSEQSENAGSGRAKRWTEAEAREALREFRESGLSAAALAVKKGISPTRLPYRTERLGTRPARDVGLVAVPLPSQHRLEVEHQGVTVRVGLLGVEELAQLVVAIARRARGC
jgi:hypothetical protein